MDSSFKLMSFNIAGYTTNSDVTRHWNNRGSVCVQILQRYNPDVIAFQEVQARNRITLDEHLKEYTCEYGAKTCYQADETAMYNAIYWKTERFDRLDAGWFYLSETPDRWSKSWDAMYVRSVTWVRLRCLQTNSTLLYANVHLDHRGLEARIESSKLILKMLMELRQSQNLPIIISGDFNARAWSPPDENIYTYPPPVAPEYLPPAFTVYNLYVEQNFKDVYLEADHHNDLATNTYHDYFGNAFPAAALRIDWIFTLNGDQQLLTKAYLVIRDACPPVYASDHYPIMADLSFSPI